MQAAGNASNVVFLPLQPARRLNELLNLADIHLLPQVSGAADLVMPSKLTGIMASGGAVVSSAGQDTQLAKVLGGIGLITPPDDAAAFAQATGQSGQRIELTGDSLRKKARKSPSAGPQAGHP